MKLRVLGCSGGIGPGRRTTSLLINDNILIDAGSGVGDLTLEEMSKIRGGGKIPDDDNPGFN